jgi:hypothetical protein
VLYIIKMDIDNLIEQVHILDAYETEQLAREQSVKSFRDVLLASYDKMVAYHHDIIAKERARLQLLLPEPPAE